VRCFVCKLNTIETNQIPTNLESVICKCGATARHNLLIELISALTPETHAIKILGCSDPSILYPALSSIGVYIPTYFDEFPNLDLLNVPNSLMGKFDIIICSEILEHVFDLPTALAGLYKLLRESGVAVVSFPLREGITIEHYPEIESYCLNQVGSGITWVSRSGQIHIDNSPTFHGGPGNNLEIRVIGNQSLDAELEAAGLEYCYQAVRNDLVNKYSINRNAGVFLFKKEQKYN
jgi:hypothetical protein